MGCMIGETRGSAVVVRRIAPADVEPSHSTATRVVPHQTCEDAGWSGTVGMIHSHPGGDRCWYYFPTTQVASSDGQSFASQPYPVDALMARGGAPKGLGGAGGGDRRRAGARGRGNPGKKVGAGRGPPGRARGSPRPPGPPPRHHQPPATPLVRGAASQESGALSRGDR